MRDYIIAVIGYALGILAFGLAAYNYPEQVCNQPMEVVDGDK